MEESQSDGHESGESNNCGAGFFGFVFSSRSRGRFDSDDEVGSLAVSLVAGARSAVSGLGVDVLKSSNGSEF